MAEGNAVSAQARSALEKQHGGGAAQALPGNRSPPPSRPHRDDRLVRRAGEEQPGRVHREGRPEGSQLAPTLRWLSLPQGEGYVWAAGEAAAMREVRQYLVAERGIDKSRIRASAYWKRGNAAVHETIDD